MPADQAQNNWYYEFMKSKDHLSMWLGVNDVETEGVWKSDRGDLQIYTNWNVGEPNNLRNEHYVEMVYNGKWNNAQDYKSYVLCTYIVPGTSL